MKMAVARVEARTTATAATVLVPIAFATLAIARFITHHVIANAISRVVAIAIAFLSM